MGPVHGENLHRVHRRMTMVRQGVKPGLTSLVAAHQGGPSAMPVWSCLLTIRCKLPSGRIVRRNLGMRAGTLVRSSDTQDRGLSLVAKDRGAAPFAERQSRLGSLQVGRRKALRRGADGRRAGSLLPSRRPGAQQQRGSGPDQKGARNNGHERKELMGKVSCRVSNFWGISAGTFIPSAPRYSSRQRVW